MSSRISTRIAVACAILGVASAAQAADCILRVGVHQVEPKSNNHPVVKADGAMSPTIGGACFLTDKVAIDVLGALPFEHDVKLVADGSKVATVRHLPPTISLQYHFNRDATFSPYVGVGVNVTLFIDEKTRGALSATTLGLGNTVGPALQLGGDFNLANNWVLGLDLRWAQIQPEATVGGAKAGLVKLDPVVYGLTIGKHFGKR